MFSETVSNWVTVDKVSKCLIRGRKSLKMPCNIGLVDLVKKRGCAPVPGTNAFNIPQ